MTYYAVPRDYAELPFKLVRKDAAVYDVQLVIQCKDDESKQATLTPKTSTEWDRIEVYANHGTCAPPADVPKAGSMIVRAAVRLVPTDYKAEATTVGAFLVYWNRDEHRPFVTWKGRLGSRLYLREASLSAALLATPIHDVAGRYAKDQPIEIDGGEIGVILDGIGPYDRPDRMWLILAFLAGLVVGVVALWLSSHS